MLLSAYNSITAFQHPLGVFYSEFFLLCPSEEDAVLESRYSFLSRDVVNEEVTVSLHSTHLCWLHSVSAHYPKLLFVIRITNCALLHGVKTTR